MTPPRILIVDQDEALLSTVPPLLSEQGYEVQVLRDPAGLFEKLAAEDPDLLLLDILMPSLDGYRALERISTDARWRDMPVLVCSALPAEDATVRLLGLGATDFVSKPCAPRELLARVQVQLHIRRELLQARRELRHTARELERARAEAERRRSLVDILHEVTGDLSVEELCYILVRRVARALNISHCSLILARPGEFTGTVVTSFENPSLRNQEIDLARHPAILDALERGTPVLIEQVAAEQQGNGSPGDWMQTGEHGLVRSVVALPFELDQEQSGIFLLRTLRDEEPLRQEDVDFADTVVKAAVSAIRRAKTMELTRADKVRFETLALTDPLTMVLNRRALMDRLVSELERARRYGLVLSLLLIDLDHFKRVNDSFGHLAGDGVLKEVARILQRQARAVDYVARYGGEEFAVVLPETPLQGAVVAGERIRKRIGSQPILRGSDGPPLEVTVSIGIAALPSLRVNSAEDIIAVADEVLYRAKAQGRNRVCS
ncbi:MAG: diguanylate cyclase [Gemmatimonadota bacterium]|nr:diguanylate cyclase [Gemmatimonadota bacterium]